VLPAAGAARLRRPCAPAGETDIAIKAAIKNLDKCIAVTLADGLGKQPLAHPARVGACLKVPSHSTPGIA
jgi:hypothetical protein